MKNSFRLVPKYARMFVGKNYRFREKNIFPRAKLKENCQLRGTDNVQGQIRAYFESQIDAIVFITLQIYFAAGEGLKVGQYSRIFFSFN